MMLTNLPLELLAYIAGSIFVYHYAVIKGYLPGVASAALRLVKKTPARPAIPDQPATLPPAVVPTLPPALKSVLAPLEDPFTAAVVKALHMKAGGIGQTLIHDYLDQLLAKPSNTPAQQSVPLPLQKAPQS